jgi:hypothetical protein
MLAQLHPFGGKPVQIGCGVGHVLCAGILVKYPQVPPAEVVCQDDDDVGVASLSSQAKLT